MNNEAIVEVGLDGSILHQYTAPNLNSESPQALAVATDGSVWFTTAGESSVQLRIPRRLAGLI